MCNVSTRIGYEMKWPYDKEIFLSKIVIGICCWLYCIFVFAVIGLKIIFGFFCLVAESAGCWGNGGDSTTKTTKHCTQKNQKRMIKNENNVVNEWSENRRLQRRNRKPWKGKSQIQKKAYLAYNLAYYIDVYYWCTCLRIATFHRKRAIQLRSLLTEPNLNGFRLFICHRTHRFPNISPFLFCCNILKVSDETIKFSMLSFFQVNQILLARTLIKWIYGHKKP